MLFDVTADRLIVTTSQVSSLLSGCTGSVVSSVKCLMAHPVLYKYYKAL